MTWRDASDFLESLDDARQPRDHGVTLPRNEPKNRLPALTNCATCGAETRGRSYCERCRSRRKRGRG